MGGRADTFCGKEAEARVSGGFIAGGEHGLQAEADAHERNSAGNGIAQRLDEFALGERAHECAEMADAGENECVARGEGFGSGGALGGHAEAGEGALDRRKISGSVFDQCDVHSRPFVLGSTRMSWRSRVAAKRSARANALKIASTW